MSNRLDSKTVYGLAPNVIKAALTLSAAVPGDLEKPLLELVKLRASQINGCAYCINMHAEDARKAGETEARLQLLPAWHEVDIYNEREKAALLWTETLTRLPNGVPDEVYAKAKAPFTDEEFVHLTSAVATINFWNRFGVGFQYRPEYK